MSKASSGLNRELAIMKRFAKTLDECSPDERMRILNWCDTRRQHEMYSKGALQAREKDVGVGVAGNGELFPE